MNDLLLKEFVYRYGIKLSKVKEVYELALKESYSLCKEDDIFYIKKIMNILLEDAGNCTENFIKSNFNDFDKFLESLLHDATLSTDFSLEQRPISNNLIITIPDVDNEEKTDNDLEYSVGKE